MTGNTVTLQGDVTEGLTHGDDEDTAGSGWDRKDVKREKSEREIELGIRQHPPLEV